MQMANNIRKYWLGLLFHENETKSKIKKCFASHPSLFLVIQWTHHIPHGIFWSFLFGENDKPTSFSYYLPSGLSPTNKNYPTGETELLFCNGYRMEHYWKNPTLKMCFIAGEGESGMNGDSSTETYTLTRVKQTANGKVLYNTWSSNPVLCDNLEGWDGVGGRREAQQGGDICKLMADSHCCMGETNTPL